MPREVKSFCRMCGGSCGMCATIGDDGRLVSLRGDHDHPLTQGYACFKGLQSPAAHNAPDRLLHPLKRKPDGTFMRIPLEDALDEIAEKLKTVVAGHGADAVAMFRGTAGNIPATAQMISDWLVALGSTSLFSTMTVDQSAKWLTPDRLGFWAAGRQPMRACDVMLIAGANPLVSIATFGFDINNPTKRLKEAKARGMTLIVIDPRRTETAHFADIFLQPRPGEDATVAAGLLRVILSRGLEDKAFCAHFVDGLARLREAVETFTPDYVARRAGVPEAEFVAAAELFARSGRKGFATTGTGPDMGPRSNLSEHLYECLNVVGGKYLRAGDPVPNSGMLMPHAPRHAEVVPPGRAFEKGRRSRVRGAGTLFGEMMSGVLADEILLPGPGQIRALFSIAGNPVSALPDQRNTVKAFKALDLLVALDSRMTTTAKLSHYVLPPKLQYERADLPTILFESWTFQVPFSHYTPAIVAPPPGAEVCDDWYPFWGLAKRLGLTLTYGGVPLDMRTAPTTDDLLAILARNAQVPLSEIKKHAQGLRVERDEVVLPARPEATGKFAVIPPDVEAEIAAVAAECFEVQTFTHRLTCRRMRDIINTSYMEVPAIRARNPYNPAFLHPSDLEAQGLKSGDRVEIVSDHGRIPAIVEADESMRAGVVSMSHGWGGLPDEEADYTEVGASTALLVATDRDFETINAMPRMSAIPVNILRVD